MNMSSSNDAVRHEGAEQGSMSLEIPERELWLQQNPTAMASVRQGLADSAAGRVKGLGSFAKYADDEIGD
jgi:hypothetical protein